LAKFQSGLFLVHHYLESLKVVECGSAETSETSFPKAGFLPLCLDPLTIKHLCDISRFLIALDWDDILSQRQSLEWHNLLLNASGWAVNESTVEVDNINDNTELAFLGSEVYKAYTADLNEASEHHLFI
jgi:hypothetical protein